MCVGGGGGGGGGGGLVLASHFKVLHSFLCYVTGEGQFLTKSQ